MRWAYKFGGNLIALSLAALLGMIVYGQVVYTYELHTGAMRVAPLFRGFVVSLVISAIAPSTRFGIRFFVFVGIYLADLALSVFASALLNELLMSVFNGDRDAAKPWGYCAVAIPLITGAGAYHVLRRYRLKPPAAKAFEKI